MWIVAWYLFCGLLIAGLLSIWRLLSQPKYRDSMGDITTEVGYEEDSMGVPHDQEFGLGMLPESKATHIGMASRDGTGMLG